jgi:hypothetical protein
VRALDLALLQAGAGIKGEFENRLKSVIAEVRSSPTPVVLFIDEAHQLIGAGGAEGQGDAANLLKPALARGELRTIAATTWAEYKKYVERDPALARRFQVVKIDEPSVTEREEMERRLVAKLQTAGQLRAGFLIRAVREQRLSLFEHGIAALGGFPITHVRAAILRPSPDALFLACAAVGIDRAVFPAVLEEIRKLSDGWPGNGDEGYHGRMTLPPAAAMREFRNLMGHIGG